MSSWQVRLTQARETTEPAVHLPARYEDRPKLYPISEELSEMMVTVQGEILNSDICFGRKCMLTCRLHDDSSVLTLHFFISTRR